VGGESPETHGKQRSNNFFTTLGRLIHITAQESQYVIFKLRWKTGGGGDLSQKSDEWREKGEGERSRGLYIGIVILKHHEQKVCQRHRIRL